MSESTSPRVRPRADVIRNRERLLQAALETVRADGGGASLEAIARRAGLGIATLYRHFPTREALFEAVYRQEVTHLTREAERLGREIGRDPLDALRVWCHACVEMVAAKKGMINALSLAVDSGQHLHAESFERLSMAVAGLVSRARDRGAMRDDISAEDLLHGVIGFCVTRQQDGWQPSVHRMVDALIDGLAVRR